jgi:hypothetical protein
MKKLRIAILFILLLAAGSSGAQQVFRVLGVSGKIKVRNGESESLVRAGSQLKNGQTLIVESGYCGLLHNKGKTVELKKPGNYSIDDLDKKIGNAANVKVKVSDKYFEYIMGQLSKKDAEDVEMSLRKHMEVPGAVQRGSESNKGLASAHLYAFPRNEVLPGKYNLAWQAVAGISKYSVKMSDRFDEIVFAKEVSGTSIEIDFASLPASGSDSYTLTVTYAGKDTSKFKEYEFKVLPKTSIEFVPETDPASSLLNGIMCEEKYLYLDAVRFYEQAVSAEPEVNTFRDALNNLNKKLGKP